MGGENGNGYGRFQFNGRLRYPHRISYELFKGAIPSGHHLDHVCHDSACVNPDHLRVSTNAENSRNALLSKANTSGFKGVCWDKRKQRWMAKICVDGRSRFLGYFVDPAEGHEAYCKAAREYFGEFANEGFAAGVALGYVGGKR